MTLQSLSSHTISKYCHLFTDAYLGIVMTGNPTKYGKILLRHFQGQGIHVLNVSHYQIEKKNTVYQILIWCLLLDCEHWLSFDETKSEIVVSWSNIHGIFSSIGEIDFSVRLTLNCEKVTNMDISSGTNIFGIHLCCIWISVYFSKV